MKHFIIPLIYAIIIGIAIGRVTRFKKELEIAYMEIKYYKNLKPPECNCYSSNLVEQPIKIYGSPVDSLCQVTWRIGYFTHEENCNNHE